MRAANVIRISSRLFVGVVIAVVVALVCIQFARIVHQNIAMSHELAAAQHDVQVLREERQSEEREVRRLTDPQGAVPEIHDRLHLVRSNEAIIYVKEAPTQRP